RGVRLHFLKLFVCKAGESFFFRPPAEIPLDFRKRHADAHIQYCSLAPYIECGDKSLDVLPAERRVHRNLFQRAYSLLSLALPVPEIFVIIYIHVRHSPLCMPSASADPAMRTEDLSAGSPR